MNEAELNEMREDMLIEQKMREDIDFAMEHLGLLEIIDAIGELTKKLDAVGHKKYYEDIVEYLGRL